jgi:hypothetical protein
MYLYNLSLPSTLFEVAFVLLKFTVLHKSVP